MNVFQELLKAMFIVLLTSEDVNASNIPNQAWNNDLLRPSLSLALYECGGIASPDVGLYVQVEFCDLRRWVRDFQTAPPESAIKNFEGYERYWMRNQIAQARLVAERYRVLANAYPDDEAWYSQLAEECDKRIAIWDTVEDCLFYRSGDHQYHRRRYDMIWVVKQIGWENVSKGYLPPILPVELMRELKHHAAHK